MSVNIYNPESLPVPVKIIVEARYSWRASLGKNEIIIRIPKHFSVADKEKKVRELVEWAKDQIHKKKYYQEQLHTLSYYMDRIVKIWSREFKIEIENIRDGKNRLSYRGDAILKIYLLEHQTEKKKVTEIQRFLLRFTEKYFLPEIQKRTIYWNDLHFKEKIDKVVLKHTISCWGSCTSARRLLFSTKLLLMPQDAIDYVIIHELAHLKEMNHSPRFWKHVERAMPDYKVHRDWLNKHGNKINF